MFIPISSIAAFIYDLTTPTLLEEDPEGAVDPGTVAEPGFFEELLYNVGTFLGISVAVLGGLLLTVIFLVGGFALVRPLPKSDPQD
ncbi:hypothetical protein [Allokutzneria albata]|uniref:hypothetical protein n=1 Tax=Allokutzneria albata TaxID=211114 RepID=UPI001B80DA7D|nr:hypothetical protein [Allokutzneria albata]